MTTERLWTWIPVASALVATLGLAVLAADPPKAEFDRKPSSYAPADDLESQVQFFLDRIKEDLKSEADYGESSIQRVTRDAHTLAVLALVLGKHDAANRYQSSAPIMLRHALTLAEKAPHYEEAKQACTQLLAPTSPSGGSTELTWESVGDPAELMQQIPKLNQKLRGQVKSEKAERFESLRGEAAGLAATLAAIAQVSIFDDSYCSDQADQASWTELCGLMRDAAFDVNQAVRRGDQKAAHDALIPLQRTCDDCHKQFKD